MSFYTTSDNQQIESINEYEAPKNDLLPIPANTNLVSAIEEVKYDDFDSERFINIKWRVIQGEFANRLIFHKIKVFNKTPQTADKAKRMLVAIDTNAGGNLLKLGREPTELELNQFLLAKIMVIKVGIWEIDKDNLGNKIPKEERKSGNWVCAVSPYSGTAEYTAPAPKLPQPPPDFKDDIPF